MKQLDNIKLKIDRPESDLLAIAQKNLGCKPRYFRILRKSLDARDKNNIFWLYSIAFSQKEELEVLPIQERIKTAPRIMVVGSGPAGLFCCLRLIDHGFKPLLVERGECVEDRTITTQKFFDEHVLNPQSNIQFGEGGAGTFSDGKVNTQTKDSLNRDVLKYFVQFGAPEEILYYNKPHIGSDKLKIVVRNMRQHILDNGGEVLFNTQFLDFECKDGCVKNAILLDIKNNRTYQKEVDGIVLALGHSARDTFEMLHKKGVMMEAKEFAVGVRIEHLANEIGLAQFGKAYKILPTADYKLVSHAHERPVFTFCMCPGGVVIPAASEEGGVVVNGMSYYARDGVNSNSALMVQMHKEDFGATDLFAGMRFQREIERRAFAMGGRTYQAPVQRFGDFVNDRVSDRYGEVKPSYLGGVTFAPLGEVLPKITVEALKNAIPDMARRLRGFDCPDALLTGVETRFSSPVKILRDENCCSVSHQGLYPCGEGAGYSGGITSSAADGLKVAEKLFQKYNL